MKKNKEPVPVYADDLPQRCEVPDCKSHGQHAHGPLFLHSRCHPDKPTWVRLDGDVATVECAVCRKPVVRLRLARKLETN